LQGLGLTGRRTCLKLQVKEITRGGSPTGGWVKQLRRKCYFAVRDNQTESEGGVKA